MTIGAALIKPRRGLFHKLVKLGVTPTLVLDAGDSQSYSSGTKWLDRSGNGYDFDFGAAGAAPTFDGPAGVQDSGTFFAMDGGDYFTYDSANESWMNQLHKDNAQYTLMAWVYIGAVGAVQVLMGTDGQDNAKIGVTWGFNGAGAMLFQVRNGDGSAEVNQSSGTATASAGAWAFYAMTYDEPTGAIAYRRNTLTDTDTATVPAPSAAAATHTLQIGASGNASAIISANSRIGELAVVNGSTLSQTVLGQIYDATRSEYGL